MPLNFKSPAFIGHVGGLDNPPVPIQIAILGGLSESVVAVLNQNQTNLNDFANAVFSESNGGLIVGWSVTKIKLRIAGSDNTAYVVLDNSDGSILAQVNIGGTTSQFYTLSSPILITSGLTLNIGVKGGGGAARPFGFLSAGGGSRIERDTSNSDAYPTITSPVIGDFLTCTGCSIGWEIEMEPPAFLEATGGNITEDGDFKIHTFNSSGNFDVTQVGLDDKVEYLVIAGGGSGSDNTGGGGAGGRLTNGTEDFAVTVQDYTITVGAGGAPTNSNGSNSIFDIIEADGGGFGGTGNGDNANDGGSGGGGGYHTSSVVRFQGGISITPPSGQGFAGGEGFANGGSTGAFGGGGGGGSSEVGEGTPIISVAGDGGDGLDSSITGSAVKKAGGGGSGIINFGSPTAGVGGAGGGGDGKIGTGLTGNNGTANTGGGGGSVFLGTGGAGGSGIVQIRYRFK